ncbi:MAG: DUF6807 family protein [Planctomycetota bacterium]|nr:DUF6807 family protein [Planctomycetota bacterium]
MRGLFFVVLYSFFASASPAEEAISFESGEDGVDVYFGARKLAEFVHTTSPAGRPFLSNLQTLDGIQVTRNYPVKDGDQSDHPHHQGLFHTFSQVNGIDYWHMRGITKHLRFLREPQVGTKTGFVVSNAYLAKDLKTSLLSETISYEFVVTELGLLILLDAVIKAEQEGVILGSKEEGGLAVRMSSDLCVETGATMLDDQGRRGGAAIWGKTARWVDNSGVKNGRWVGVTLMTHPGNGRLYHWHARDYGLLTANPLGPLNTAPDRILKAGDSMRFRYAVMVHSSQTREQYSPVAAQAVYQRYTSTQTQ